MIVPVSPSAGRSVLWQSEATSLIDMLKPGLVLESSVMKVILKLKVDDLNVGLLDFRPHHVNILPYSRVSFTESTHCPSTLPCRLKLSSVVEKP